jgi:tetratricopeptide (TPR) repeat protein
MYRTLVLTLIVLGAPLTVQAQALPLKRTLPPTSWEGCVRGSERAAVSAEDGARADALAAEAAQALILGDNVAALNLLTAAAELDPNSELVAYRRGRTLQRLERGEDALAEYCRFLDLAPDAPESAEVRDRIDGIVAARGFTVPAAAAQAYSTGLGHFDAGRAVEAGAAFDAAARAAPSWAAAVYNRGLARLAAGDAAAAGRDLRHYLELTPGSPDFGPVLDLVGTLQAAPRAPHDPFTALAAGLLVPGLGHFTTGRPRDGVVFLGLAAGMVGVGVLVGRSDVQCLSPPEQGRCPPEQVLGERTRRPLLVPALLGAAATAAYGAVDAYRGARRARDGQQRLRGDGSGLSFAPPAIDAGPGGTELTILRLFF